MKWWHEIDSCTRTCWNICGSQWTMKRCIYFSRNINPGPWFELSKTWDLRGENFLSMMFRKMVYKKRKTWACLGDSGSLTTWNSVTEDMNGPCLAWRISLIEGSSSKRLTTTSNNLIQNRPTQARKKPYAHAAFEELFSTASHPLNAKRRSEYLNRPQSFFGYLMHNILHPFAGYHFILKLSHPSS